MILDTVRLMRGTRLIQNPQKRVRSKSYLSSVIFFLVGGRGVGWDVVVAYQKSSCKPKFNSGPVFNPFTVSGSHGDWKNIPIFQLF